MLTDSTSLSAEPDLRYLKGVGPKRVLSLQKLRIYSIRDLLYYFPKRYEDRSQHIAIKDIEPGTRVTISGSILSVKLVRLKRLQILEVLVGDEFQTIHAVWFNQAYLRNQFKEGQEVIFYGKADFYKKRLQLNSPEFEILGDQEEHTHAGRITPIYSLKEGVFQKSLRTTLKNACDQYLDTILHEFLPESYRAKLGLLELKKAVHEMHFPSTFEALEYARKRIVHDEFLLFEISLLRRMKRLREKYKSFEIESVDKDYKAFMQKLPFEPTSAQEKAMHEIAASLEKRYPMNRLLQGDVGSGKTLTAAYGFYLAAKNKKQAALLVPTEVLATQHFRTLSKLLKPFGISVELLTSNTPNEKRARLFYELKNNKINLLVGTHAILNDKIEFKKLAMVVIDEQHKFGVYQRSHLLTQNPRPHQLIMTATPIPRTLALTVYGDLDVSVLDELPKGRKPIKTYWITRKKQDKVLAHIRERVEKGDQAYFIFPLIEETEKSDLLAATKQFEKLKKKAFKGISMGLVHGKIPADQRDVIMRDFKEGEVKILVSTSVIEVGVDNPNATVMVIENAERFGLSQLHQMRGRIGRGEKASECFLFGEPKTQEGQKRLRILTKTQDGFVIAEEDLKLRGPGDFLGTRQSGDPLFKVASASRDYELLLKVRSEAKHLIDSDDINTADEWKLLRQHLASQDLNY